MLVVSELELKHALYDSTVNVHIVYEVNPQTTWLGDPQLSDGKLKKDTYSSSGTAATKNTII